MFDFNAERFVLGSNSSMFHTVSWLAFSFNYQTGTLEDTHVNNLFPPPISISSTAMWGMFCTFSQSFRYLFGPPTKNLLHSEDWFFFFLSKKSWSNERLLKDKNQCFTHWTRLTPQVWATSLRPSGRHRSQAPPTIWARSLDSLFPAPKTQEKHQQPKRWLSTVTEIWYLSCDSQHWIETGSLQESMQHDQKIGSMFTFF